jgi:hypothetical protein
MPAFVNSAGRDGVLKSDAHLFRARADLSQARVNISATSADEALAAAAASQQLGRFTASQAKAFSALAAIEPRRRHRGFRPSPDSTPAQAAASDG